MNYLLDEGVLEAIKECMQTYTDNRDVLDETMNALGSLFPTGTCFVR